MTRPDPHPDKPLEEDSQPRVRVYHQNHTAGEKASGLAWLSGIAVVFALWEIAASGSSLTLPLGARPTIPVPFTIPVAVAMNIVFARAGLLWSRLWFVAAIPLVTWAVAAGVMTTFLWDSHGCSWRNVRMLAVIAAGVVGAVGGCVLGLNRTSPEGSCPKGSSSEPSF